MLERPYPRATVWPTRGWARSLVLAGLATLGACGTQQELQPKPGVPMPVAPLGQTQPQTAEALLTPSPEERPDRRDELLKRSEPREPDPFDLPPS